jgi:hypothetical protein
MPRKNIDVIRKVNQLKSKLFYPRLHAAFQSTICFFRNGDKKLVEPAGSGLFLQIDGLYYVVTAAHVLAENYEDTFVILEDKELVLGGRLVSSPMPQTKSRNDDKIDISILKLDQQSSQDMLTRFRPVTETEIEVEHQMNDLSTYFSVGFPLTRTGIKWGTNEIKSIGHSYQSIPTMNFDFKKFGFSDKTTYSIEYDRLVTSGDNPQTHYSPDLTGISGSGLWYFSDTNKKSLIGITIERISDPKYKCLLSTKISVVMKMIKEMN